MSNNSTRAKELTSTVLLDSDLSFESEVFLLLYALLLSCKESVRMLVLTLIRLGGGGHDGPPPLDISHNYSAMREALTATLYDNFLSSFPHILTLNL